MPGVRSHRSACLAAAVALAACGSDGGPGGTSTAPSGSTRASAEFRTAGCGTYSGSGCAPLSKRVDRARPSFSNPTTITNPLFPISRLRSAVLLGKASGKPFRSETTLMPTTATVAVDGSRVRVLLSQYMAFNDGRLEEVALDRYAQADDGSVWYLGEDVYDYRKGAVAFTEGTWLAGREGPAAMIMPARPKVGDAFRAENVPGVVFEEVKVADVGKTVDGPRGPVKGAVTGAELHLDGSYDYKTFAPGYGEFRTTGGGDLEALALAVPTDALSGPEPAQLVSLSTSTEGILESARVCDWEAVTTTLARIEADWKSLSAMRPPPLIAGRMDAAVAALRRAAKAREVAAIGQAAIDAARSTQDLRLRYRPPAAIDAARFHLWTQQLRVDAAAKDLAGVTGDVAVLEWVRDRFAPTLAPAARAELDSRLRELRTAADTRNLATAADHAARLGARVRTLVAQ
jgi:hypothetical protein